MMDFGQKADLLRFETGGTCRCLIFGLRFHPRSAHGAFLWADTTEATAASMLPFPFLPTRMVFIWVHPPRQDKVRSMLIYLLAFFEGSANLFG